MHLVREQELPLSSQVVRVLADMFAFALRRKCGQDDADAMTCTHCILYAAVFSHSIIIPDLMNMEIGAQKA